MILQGSHLGVGRPLYKYPNPSMLHNTDWTETDLEALAPEDIPVTSYKPRGDKAAYDAAYTHWTSPTAEPESFATSARDHYRVAWRRMAANTGERTLIAAIIPPGAAHVDGIVAAAPLRGGRITALVAAAASSLLFDFMTRVAPKGDIRAPQFNRLPVVTLETVIDAIVLRSLRLNCVTATYAPLWRECFHTEFLRDTWTANPKLIVDCRPLGPVGEEWTPEVPLRVAVDRRQALLEIDALVALGLGITADELVTIYRTQFPVLYGYDRNAYFYDRNGRRVPNNVLSEWRKKGDDLPPDDRIAEHPGSGSRYLYELPFRTLDREQDLRRAHAVFRERIQSRRSNSS